MFIISQINFILHTYSRPTDFFEFRFTKIWSKISVSACLPQFINESYASDAIEVILIILAPHPGIFTKKVFLKDQFLVHFCF